MKILIVNKAADGQAIAEFYAYAFQQLGAKVYKLDLFYMMQREPVTCQNVPFNLCRIYRYKILKHLAGAVWSMRNETRERITEKAKQIKPDIIFVFGDMAMEPDIFKEIKNHVTACKIYSYVTDPLAVSNSLRDSMPCYDCIFTFSRFQVPLLYWFGAQHVEYLPLGFDSRVHRALNLNPAEKDFYGSTIAYLGTWQPHIEHWMAELTAYGLKIWGNQWYRSQGYPLIRKCWKGEGLGLYADMAKVINASQIIFNVVRYYNGSGHSMKTFEIPACNGFMLTNRTEEQLGFFPEDKCAVYFSTKEELKDKLEYYSHNAQARANISKEAHRVVQHHTYTARAKEIMRFYGKYDANK